MNMDKFIKKNYGKGEKEINTENTDKAENTDKDYSVEIGASGKEKASEIKKEKVNFIDGLKKKEVEKKALKELSQKNKEILLEEKINLIKSNIEKQKKENAYPTHEEIVKYLSIAEEKEAKEFLKTLSEEEIVQITKELMKKPVVEPEEKEYLKKKFQKYTKKVNFDETIKGSNNLAQDFLEKTIGKEIAKKIYRKVLGGTEGIKEKYLSELDKFSDEEIYFAILSEDVYVLSFIIMGLEKEKAAKILSKFPKEKQKEIIKRMSQIKKVSLFAVEGIKEKIIEKIKNAPSINIENLEGKEIIKEIIKNMSFSDSERLIKNLKETDLEIGEELEKVNLESKVLSRISSRDLQHILLGYSEEDIAIIIRNKNENFKQTILANLSEKRRGEVLKISGEMQSISLRLIESKTDDFIDFVKTLSFDSEISI